MITTFEITNDKKGILVSQKRGGKVIRETYAVDDRDAKLIRIAWVNEFWGKTPIIYNNYDGKKIKLRAKINTPA